jgi:hypothetical protein
MLRRSAIDGLAAMADNSSSRPAGVALPVLGGSNVRVHAAVDVDRYADTAQFTNCGPPLTVSPPIQSRVPSEILQTYDELRGS